MRIAFAGFCLFALALFASEGRSAVISYSTDLFDAEADISTTGTLVQAYNLGTTTAVTVNGVAFAADPGASPFWVSGGADYTDTAYYSGGAIGTVTAVNANALLDTTEYAGGVGNSLARVSGLTVGQSYEIQILTSFQSEPTRTADFGYATPSGDATEVYPLTGVDEAARVTTGTFVASQTIQDVHQFRTPSSNGQIQAYQLRAIPEPSTLLLAALGLLGLLGCARRRRR